MAEPGKDVDYNPFGTPVGATPGRDVDYNPFQPQKDPVTGFLHGIPGVAKNFAVPFMEYFPEQGQMAREGAQRFGRGVQNIAGGLAADIAPSTRPEVGPFPSPSQRFAAGVVGTGLGAVENVTSPYNAFLRSFVGSPVERVTGIPKEYTEFAASFGIPFMPKRIPTAYPRTPPPNRMAGVTLSEGEATGDLSKIQREQAAIRGNAGPPAQQAAAAFQEQRARELPQARQAVLEGMSPEDTIVARTPQEAAELAQQRLIQEQTKAKTAVDTAFTEARAQPGMIRSEALDEVPSRIPIELAAREEPVVLGQGPGVSGVADNMVKYLEGVTGRLRATREGAEGPGIAGLTLRQVENERRQLSGMRSQAWGVNATEGRAASAVMEEFDNAIDRAVKSGQFTGEPEAVAAWNRARAAHSEMRATFGDPRGSAAKDPVGHVVQQIMGSNPTTGNMPTVVSDVISHMYGSTGVTPSSLNVAVATRLRNIFGETSKEWAAVKQGLFSKLADLGEGMGEMGAKKAADRITRFFNENPQMANVVFSPSDRRLMKDYADMQRSIVIPQAGANWSNTAMATGQTYKYSLPFRMMQALGSHIGMIIGGSLVSGGGHLLSELGLGALGAGGTVALGQKAVAMTAQSREAAQIARQMPVLKNTMREYERASRAHGLSPSQYTATRLAISTNLLTDVFQRVGIPLPIDFTGPQ